MRTEVGKAVVGQDGAVTGLIIALLTRGHALDQLRIGTIGRIAAVLKLPRSAPVDAVADAAALATGRDPASVARLLVGAAPTGDHELVDLAAELDRLEHDVAASVRPDPDDRTDPTGRRP